MMGIGDLLMNDIHLQYPTTTLSELRSSIELIIQIEVGLIYHLL